MLRLAVVLAALAAATPAFAAPREQPAPQPRLAAVGCPDMDPGFVRYVPPATKAGGPNSLLWLVGGSPAEPQTSAPTRRYSSSPCVRPLQTLMAK